MKDQIIIKNEEKTMLIKSVKNIHHPNDFYQFKNSSVELVKAIDEFRNKYFIYLWNKLQSKL